MLCSSNNDLRSWDLLEQTAGMLLGDWRMDMIALLRYKLLPFEKRLLPDSLLCPSDKAPVLIESVLNLIFFLRLLISLADWQDLKL